MHELSPPESVAGAARLLGVSSRLVYDMIDRGEIAAVRIGRRRLVVPRSEIERILAGTTTAATS